MSSKNWIPNVPVSIKNIKPTPIMFKSLFWDTKSKHLSPLIFFYNLEIQAR